MKIVTLGELMLRLQPFDHLRFVQSEDYEATFGGGEANVAVSLANYGCDAYFVSKLPTHEIGQAAVNSLRKYGVKTDYVVRGGDRVGIYFLEKGASQRASKVIYDRANSAFALSNYEEYDWDAIFDGATWLHFSGITPALGDNVAKLTEEALIAAKRHGVTVSCDLNYRNKLRSKDKAREVMTRLMKYVDVCIGNEDDANDVFGITPENNDTSKGQLNKEGYVSVAKRLKDKFGFKYVALTLRTSISASENNWAAMLYDGNSYLSKEYHMQIIDRVGGGDSFAGGLIYGLTHDYKPQDAIEFAVAASCLKHSIEGDYNLVSVDEVKKLAGGDGSGRVQR